MSNWDLMMPGMGLTAIGITGVTIAYSGIAHTFIDGMHALTGLTLFLGLIFLSAGILEGGVSTSNRAKATTLVILGIAFSFGLAALNFNTVTSLPTFAGVMLIIAVPSIVMAYVTMKMPQYAKPVSVIFILAVGAAIASYVGFGLVGPTQYLVPPPVEEEKKPEVPVSTVPVFKISILKDSQTQGNPDFDPDMAQVPMGDVIEWTNNDSVAHTVTSAVDAGSTFDSSLISAGSTFKLDTSSLKPAKYDYFCIVHPWMTASFEVVQGGASASSVPTVAISILKDSQTQGNPDYDPDMAQVPTGSTIVWTNEDTVAHTVTSAVDAGSTFDSSLISAGSTFKLDTSSLKPAKYDYFCMVHPWMTASFELGKVTEQPEARLTEDAMASDPNSVIPEQTPSETPVETTPVNPQEQPAPTEPVGTQPTDEQVETGGIMVSIASGASSPGCEKTNECFNPDIITAIVGNTVTWTNDDTAAHTVTSGKDTTADGTFDSSLLPAGKTFSFKFESSGEYPYYCVVHPWMTGKVIVE
jgi:plastocyanin